MYRDDLIWIVLFLKLGVPTIYVLLRILPTPSSRPRRLPRITEKNTGIEYRKHRRRLDDARARVQARRVLEEAIRRSERAELRAARRLERDVAYKARGIEPGPLAWFKALPDVVQSLLIGIGIAGPVVVVLAAIFRSM